MGSFVFMNRAQANPWLATTISFLLMLFLAVFAGLMLIQKLGAELMVAGVALISLF